MRDLDLKDMAVYLMRHPRDVPVVARAAWRLRARAWWRHSPFLPLPDPAYWEFRRSTVNGSSEVAVSASSIVEAARWSARQPGGR